MAASAMLAGDPSRLGDFWLAGRLGAGGQGVVYEAYDVQGTRVAIKVLHPDTAADPDMRSRFGKEVTAARRVASFCTARILAVDLDAPKPYIVSEYIQGPSLRKAVTDGRRFTGDDLHRLATAIATALTAIHDAGVIHRDLKPDNVLLGPDGPRVIDFGIARTLEMSLTATGLVTGTPTYMAPEVFTGQRAGAPADVFSWGAIVVYAANGDDPFEAESLGAVMHRVLATDPDLNNLPPSLRHLVAAALSKDPLARPTARELLLGLITGFDGTQAELLSMGSAEAGLLGLGITADPSLGTLAEDAYGFLNPTERNLVPDFFLRMVAVAETGDITTRPASRKELLDGKTSEEQAALRRVLEVFAYLLAGQGDDLVLSRSALIRAWPRLWSWVADERDGLPAHDMIHKAARHWSDHGRREADVFQGSRLETALRWAATGRRHLTLGKLERDFLDACDTVTRHRVRRRRLLTVTLAALLVLALIGGTIAVRQTWTVTTQREMLALQLAETTAGKLAAEADTMRTTDPARAMLLSVAAWRLAHLPTTRATLQNAWAQRERTAFIDPDTGGETLRQITLDGRRLVSVSPQGVRVYDLRTGQKAGGWDDVGIGDRAFRAIALSADGRYLAVVAGDTIQVWDLTTQRPTAQHKLVAQQHFNGVSYGLSDRWLTISEGQGAQLWDTRTGAMVGGPEPIADTALTSAGDLAAVTLLGETEHFGLLRLPGGKPVAGWHASDTCLSKSSSVAFSPDGHTLACATTSDISLIDVRTGKSLPNQPRADGWDSNGGRIRFSPDGRFIVAIGNSDLRLIRVADGSTLLTYRGAVEAAGFDGMTLRLLSDATVVDVDVSDLLNPVRIPGPPPAYAVFSPDGRFLLTHNEGASSLVLRDAQDGRALGHPLPLASGDTPDPFPVFSGDGRLLAIVEGPSGEFVSVWDTQRRIRTAKIELPKGWYLYSLAMNADGSMLVAGARTITGEDEETRGRLLAWDVKAGRWIRSIDISGDVAVAFRPGSTMVAEVEGPSNRLLDLTTGRETGPGLGPQRVTDPRVSLAFSPDGNTIAIGSSKGLAFWDVRTGQRRGPNLQLSSSDVIFSPKGDVAASVNREFSVQLLDASAPEWLGPPFSGGDTQLLSAAFGSRGTVVHTVDDSGALRDIPVDPSRMAAIVCARVGRTLTPAEWHRYLPDLPYRDPCR
ncbi:WD40 repeat domain-containing serine/threonine protein kinase [Acrocarpospora macrocephala]|nr:serine/threonine-protein kinase [Acrocarpospora macrocephala]